jgi:hypothetical protein
MMRKEPATLAVMILMIALLLFGVWKSWPVPKVQADISVINVMPA